MTSPVSRRTPALTPCAPAGAIALCFFCAAPAFAQDAMPSATPVVVITGARFASAPELAPIGATVIGAADIRRSGVGDVNQAIRKIGGVYGRPSLAGGSDYDLDIRGFGSNSSQNLVVVLDGVRMSENEQIPAVLSMIPIDDVERIEIVRGSSSVLYGEGATAGVISIITKRPAGRAGGGSLYAGLGQFGQREARAAVTQAWDSFALNASLADQHTDNYRANSAFKQVNFSGGIESTSSNGRLGLRIDSTRQESRFPGALSLTQFDANPRQTNTPNDFGSLDIDRLTALVERQVGSLDLAAELSHREKAVKSTVFFFGSPSAFATVSRQTQFSPRARVLGRGRAVLNEAVIGIDLADWNRITDATFSQADVSQRSRALYMRDEVKFDGAHNVRIAAGARHETFDKKSVDANPFGYNYDISQDFNAWDVQSSFDAVPMLNLYAKAGQSYRVANVDENGFTPVPSQPLKGQTSHDLELGATLGGSVRSLTVRLFQHKLNNEIFFHPTIVPFGANTNLDPTKRAGFELEASARVAADWRLKAQVQYVKASFTAGANAGRQVVLVPENIVSTRLAWMPSGGQSADVGVQWVGRQRNGDDFDNSCSALMPAFATFDARYAKKFGAWELAFTGLNLSDKHYYSTAFYEKSGPKCQPKVYPSDGRQLKVSARYDF